MNTLPLCDAVDRIRSEPRVHATLQRLSHACRQFEDIDALVEDLAVVVADGERVGRLLVFLKESENGAFRFKWGLRVHRDSETLAYSETDPLPLWLQFNAHMVCRSTLSSIANLDERLMLENELVSHASEVLVPLFGRHELLGWLLLGGHASGCPYTDSDLLDLFVFADHMAITLENALLHKEVEEQRSLTKALISHLPDGVVAVDKEGVIRWANHRTFDVLSPAGTAGIDHPVECLGSRVADAIRRCLGDEAEEATRQWENPATLRPISVTTRRLEQDGHHRGAMAVVRDLYWEERLKRQEDRIERKAFYQGLAASIDHELGNALVPVTTALGMLRNSDAADAELMDFVDGGIARIDKLRQMFNRCATMPDPVFRPCRIEGLLGEAVKSAKDATGRSDCPVRVEHTGQTPDVEGDRTLLVQAFGHILENAMEAVGEEPDGRIHVQTSTRGPDHQNLVVNIENNVESLDSKVEEQDPFSPFTTTKRWPGGGDRAIGLGLPIARQTILDHNGQVDLHSRSHSVQVSITLPFRQPDRLNQSALSPLCCRAQCYTT